MTTPYLHKCAKCGESWWDAHVCAKEISITFPSGPWSKEAEMRESWKAAQPVEQREVILRFMADKGYYLGKESMDELMSMLAADKGGV